MEQLVGPNVQVTLGVKQGRGFETFQKPILVVASLEGHNLNTNILASSSEPHFDAELVWETDKQAVRRLRTAKVPLKVDCFTLTNPTTRSKIGSVLLNLLSAYIAPRGKANPSYPEIWHKLICRNSDGTTTNVELLLSLRIEEVRENEEQAMGDTCGLPARLYNTHLVEPAQGKQKIIQVGPSLMGTDLFKLAIELEAANLDALGLNNLPTTDLYFMCHIFGHKLRTNLLGPEVSNLGSTSQKLIVQVRSSLKFLRQHLESLLLLKLMCGENDVGFTTMDIGALIPTDNLTDFLERHATDNGISTNCRCFFTLANAEPENANDVRAHADVSLRLKYCRPVSPNQQLPVPLTKKKSERRLNTMEAGGDGNTSPERLNVYTQELPKQVEAIPQLRKTASTTSFAAERTVDYGRPLPSSEPHLRRVYNTFTLDISLENVLFNELPPENKVFFKFHHPKAEIISTTHPEVVVSHLDKMMTLEGIRCKLRFVSTTEEISRLLLAWPPKISVCTTIDDQIVQLAITTLDIARLLADKKRCIYPASMTDLVNGREVGSLYIAMNLENNGEHMEEGEARGGEARGGKAVEQELGPAVLDDRIAYRIVAELEDWKEKQQEIFKAELSAKEERHLQLLVTEFQTRRESLEMKLNRNVEESRQLSESLHVAAQELQSRASKQAEAEMELAIRREELERRYTMKFEDLREASKRLEEDLYHKVKLIENRNTELLVTVQRLEKENALLNESSRQQESVLIEKNQKNSLTQDQTASLLQEMKVLEEKLETVTKSKAYFKKQWSQAARELHTIKSEHQEAMQLQIRGFKEELKSLGFQRLLNEEASELSEDQEVIQLLKSEIEQDRREGQYFNKKLSTMFSPRNTAKQQMSGGRRQTQEEVEAKLRQAINERDALLRTGNYSMDDRVLDEINREIRKQINNVNSAKIE